jgi:5-methylthioadenosine/S-adenosylhomocysteine deaminase
MRSKKLLTINETELLAQAQDMAKKIDIFLMEREQSVLSKLIALGGSLEEESFEVQTKVRVTGPDAIVKKIKQKEVEIVRFRHYSEHDVYFSFDDEKQGRLRYREDDFLDEKGKPTSTRGRLTLIGVKREDKMAHDVLLSRSRFLAPAIHSLRFYREYFKPQQEMEIKKDRLRWLIRYKETEFFINLDEIIIPDSGHFLEIKSRTWSRKDAEHKVELVNELLDLLGQGNVQPVTQDYIEFIT